MDGRVVKTQGGKCSQQNHGCQQNRGKSKLSTTLLQHKNHVDERSLKQAVQEGKHVRIFLEDIHVNLVSIQETKLEVIDRYTVLQCLGPSFDGFTYLPACQTRGGILLAWNSSVLEVKNTSCDTYALTGEVHSRDNQTWWITVVYGPQTDADKIQFLQQLTERRSLCPGPWLLLGDFNMILHAAEKNNDNLNRRMMARFRDFVNGRELKEIYLHGRQFTWSNGRAVPTMTRIDRAFASIDWELAYHDTLLQALSSSISDHAPLHLSMMAGLRPKRRFHFEHFWLKMEGFEEAVREGWQCNSATLDPFLRLDNLYRNLARHLQAWSE